MPFAPRLECPLLYLAGRLKREGSHLCFLYQVADKCCLLEIGIQSSHRVVCLPGKIDVFPADFMHGVVGQQNRAMGVAPQGELHGINRDIRVYSTHRDMDLRASRPLSRAGVNRHRLTVLDVGPGYLPVVSQPQRLAEKELATDDRVGVGRPNDETKSQP